MLVLGRKPGQGIRIGHDITVTICRVRGSLVSLGIAAEGRSVTRIGRRDIDEIRDRDDRDLDRDSGDTRRGQDANGDDASKVRGG